MVCCFGVFFLSKPKFSKLNYQTNILIDSFLKTIDKYLIRQFIGPFIATFFIALFVLMMQFIWVYVDDMVGKGAGFGLVMEIIFYNSISLIPWALPIAILISSVMVLGNLGERYELASLKSAGVPLIRVIQPLLYFTIGVTIFSFFSSNNLVPVSNLKFKSRLHDIRTQKPTLNLEEGVFNEDFGGFIIHIGKKEADNRSIKDVIIYDHKEYNKGKLSMITSEDGEMYMTGDNQYFIMNLKNGYHYQESEQNKKKDKEKYPFMRTKFEEWTKVFDTREFNIDLTDMDRFKNHYTMLSVRQLYNAIDSLDGRMDSYRTRLDEYTQKAFFPLKQKLAEKRKKENKKRLEAERKKAAERKAAKKAKEEKEKKILEEKSGKKESVLPKKEANKKKTTKKKTTKKVNQPKPKKKVKKNRTINKSLTKKQKSKIKNARDKATLMDKKDVEKRKAEAERKKKKREKDKAIKQVIDKDLKEYASFFQTFPESESARFNLKERAKTSARGVFNQSQAIQRSVNPKKEIRVKHVFVLYSKFSFALVCCVFLFIGASMGAIVRKGGFGYPLLIAILFFVLFIVLNILFQKLAESYVLPAEFAVWCPLLVLIPIAFILTKRAMQDKKAVNLDRYGAWLQFVIRFVKGLISA